VGVDLKKSAQHLALVLGLLALSMSGCSSQMTQAQAEAKLLTAHEECLSKSLEEEVPFSDITTQSISGLAYYYEDQIDRSFVKCVSQSLFGKDVTNLVHTREDLMRFETKGRVASDLDGVFVSDEHEGWDEPFSFVRYDGELDASYFFEWHSPK
jgi:hypothetical protein